MTTIQWRGRDIPATPGSDLLGSLLDGKADILYLCMSGSCGRCRVRVTQGGESLAPLTAAEEMHGCSEPHDRLACQTILGTGDIAVEQGG
jgi:ferredoxin